MKTKTPHKIESREILRSHDQKVQAEIENFLQALDSYPDQAAKEPSLSFQQHLCGFLASHRNDRTRSRQ